jgi:hypothetical protein
MHAPFFAENNEYFSKYNLANLEIKSLRLKAVFKVRYNWHYGKYWQINISSSRMNNRNLTSLLEIQTSS